MRGFTKAYASGLHWRGLREFIFRLLLVIQAFYRAAEVSRSAGTTKHMQCFIPRPAQFCCGSSVAPLLSANWLSQYNLYSCQCRASQEMRRSYAPISPEKSLLSLSAARGSTLAAPNAKIRTVLLKVLAPSPSSSSKQASQPKPPTRCSHGHESGPGERNLQRLKQTLL